MDDDVMYYRWIANDGPAKMTAEHKALALDSMSRFAADGIAVLAWRMHRSAFEEVAKVEVLVEYDDERHTLLRKWWSNRHAAITSVWNTLLAVRLDEFTIGPIEADGELMTGPKRFIYEWKQDTGGKGQGPYLFLGPEANFPGLRP